MAQHLANTLVDNVTDTGDDKHKNDEHKDQNGNEKLNNNNNNNGNDNKRSSIKINDELIENTIEFDQLIFPNDVKILNDKLNYNVLFNEI